jgi:hypothetical protein
MQILYAPWAWRWLLLQKTRVRVNSKTVTSRHTEQKKQSGEVMSLHAQGTSPNLMLPPFWLKFQQTEELTNYYQQPLASLRLGQSGLAVVCASTYYARALAIKTPTNVKSLTWVSTFINAANKSFNEGTLHYSAVRHGQRRRRLLQRRRRSVSRRSRRE